MKKLQVKPAPLECTCTSLCWCNDLSFRFPMDQVQDECMSPKEILKLFGADVSERDRKYLEGLLDREFIPN